jgi:hypothetical protein
VIAALVLAWVGGMTLGFVVGRLTAPQLRDPSPRPVERAGDAARAPAGAAGAARADLAATRKRQAMPRIGDAS